MYAEQLYRYMPRKGNLFFSSESIRLSLAMATLGARGSTRDQLVEKLELPNQDREILAWLREMTEPTTIPGIELNIANRMYAQTGYPFDPTYVQAMKTLRGFKKADFQANVEHERSRINRWVGKRTKDRIKNLIPQGTLDVLTRAVMVNATYFKAPWASKFDPKTTHMAAFRGAGLIPTMYQENLFAYARPCPADVVHRLWLPYVAEPFGMLVIMPNDGYTLEHAEREVEIKGWDKLKPTDRYNVRLSMPKWETRWGTQNIIPVLQEMGIIDAFDEDLADFTGMSQVKGDISLSHVLHQAFGRVDEDGSEAAAATATVARGKSPAPPTVELHLDRPILYAIMFGTIPLFIGRLIKPEAPKAESGGLHIIRNARGA